MAGFRDFLMRFRPAGAPGRAAPVGVPADRSAELAVELEPPLALLESAETEARVIRGQAVREAERRRSEAGGRARATVSEARGRVGQVAAESAERVRATARAEVTEILASAERETAMTRRLAQARMPALVDRVVQLLTDDLRTAPGPEAPGPEAPSSEAPDSAAGLHGSGS